MRNLQRAGLICALMAFLVIPARPQNRREFSAPLAPGASVSLVNEYGSVTVQTSTGTTLVVTALPHSSKVDVDFSPINKSRVEIRSKLLQNTPAEDLQVDYQVQLPAGITVSIHSSSGAVNVDGVSGDVFCEGESAAFEVRNVTDGHLRVHTVDGPVTLANLRNTNVEVISVSGDVTLNQVIGTGIKVNTAKGNVSYLGDFGGVGNYVLSTHSGDISVSMPATASADISAKTVQGSVEDSFHLDSATSSVAATPQAKSFAGKANSGAASVKLRSFNGKIRVSKQ